MWRSQIHKDSYSDLDLDLNLIRGQVVNQKLRKCHIPPHDSNLSESHYKYPLSMVRPDYEGITKTTSKSLLPSAPELPYSKHTPPHFMDNNNPEKYFKSGYTGNRFLTYPQFGSNSKVETHSALCDFTNDYQFTKSMEWAPLPFYHVSLDGDKPGSDIYPRQTGLMPSYKGHVPGMQYSYGRTFGTESVNAKRYLGLRPCLRENNKKDFY